MDQDAFRSILSAPRAAQAGPSRHVLGGGHAPKRNGWGLKPKDGVTYESKEGQESGQPAFAPRQYHKKAALDSKYKDRAELRRQGVDDEYKGVEKLLEDFEKRKQEAGEEDAEKIEELRKHLGGDAEHSILVKGLDYALLAARKAELEAEKSGQVDDELDELAMGIGSKAKGQAVKEEKSEKKPKEELGRGFKSIAAKKAEAEDGKKKKKKKKKKLESDPSVKAPPAPAPAGVKTEEDVKPGLQSAEAKREPAETAAAPPPPPPPVEEEDEDIFADAGEYDLTAALPETDDEDEKEEEVTKPKEDGDIRKRGRSRSRSRSRGRYDSYSPDPRRRRESDEYRRRSPSPARRRYRSRSRSPGGDGRRRLYSPSPPPRRRRHSRSPSPYHRRRRSPSPYQRRRSPSPYRRRSPSPPPRRRYSPSPSSPRRHHSPSPSPSPPPTKRARTRSPSPLLNGPPIDRYAFSRSPSPSSSTSSAAGHSSRPTKLQPLFGSTITDVRSFLAAEEDAAAHEEKRLRKAEWRIKQGQGLPEGVTMEDLDRMRKEREKREEAAAEEGGGSARGRGGGRGGVSGRGGGGRGGGEAGKGKGKREKMRENEEYVKIMRRVEQGRKGEGEGE